MLLWSQAANSPCKRKIDLGNRDGHHVIGGFDNAGRARAGACARTNLVHNRAMRTERTVVRQSVSLPANVALQVRSMAKTRRLSANRMLVELIENGIEAEKRKQQEFFDLAQRFRAAEDPEEVKRLGDEMGQMIFGD